MKKPIYSSLGIFCAGLGLTLGVRAFAADAPQKVRIAYASRSSSAMPQYMAQSKGFFKAEGLDVEPAGALGGGTVDALLKGDADVSLSGIMRSFDLRDRGGARLVHFAGVNDRNGFFLLSRQPRPGFRWPDLVGRTVISFGGAPTPWLCMQTVLRRHGVDPARVRFRRDLDTPEAVAAFRAGQAPQPMRPEVDEVESGR